jgi:hypothetical protein
MKTYVWITCKNAQRAADDVMHRLLDSKWTVGAAGKDGMVWGDDDSSLQVAGLSLNGEPRSGALVQ